MVIEYYNFLDVVKLQIEKPDKCGFFNKFNPQFQYFKVNELDPNITVTIGPFKRCSKKLLNSGNKWIREDYFYTHDVFQNSKWKLEIQGWETSAFNVRLDPNPRGVRKLFRCFSMQNVFLTELIELLFIENGYSVIHGSTVTRDDGAIIVTGSDHTYKTSLIMDLVRSGYAFLSDDKVIIKDNYVYPYPVNLLSFIFWMDHLKNEDHRIPLYNLRLLLWFRKKHGRRDFAINIGNRSKIDRIFILKRGSNNENLPSSLENNDGLNLLVSDYKREWEKGYMPTITGLNKGFFKDYFNSYIKHVPNSKYKDFWTRYSSLLASNLKLDFNVMSMGDTYSRSLIHRIN